MWIGAGLAMVSMCGLAFLVVVRDRLDVRYPGAAVIAEHRLTRFAPNFTLRRSLRYR
jgi:hypothetical protein